MVHYSIAQIGWRVDKMEWAYLGLGRVSSITSDAPNLSCFQVEYGVRIVSQLSVGGAVTLFYTVIHYPYPTLFFYDVRNRTVVNKQKTNKSDPPFMNLSIDEMSARISARDKDLNRRNCLILLIFFGVGLVGFGISAWYYGEWMVETVGALWLLGGFLWRSEWLQAAEILFHYKLSFFIFGILFGFGLFLFVAFQIGEMIVDLLWDGITSLFN